NSSRSASGTGRISGNVNLPFRDKGTRGEGDRVAKVAKVANQTEVVMFGLLTGHPHLPVALSPPLRLDILGPLLGDDNLPELRDFPGEGLVEVDLHGYSVLTAGRIALEKVREAHARGYRVVRLITGRSTARGRGGHGPPTIRAEVREMLERGDFAR